MYKEETLNKICTKCKIKKEISEFYLDKRKKDGLKSECKACHILMGSNYYRNNILLFKKYREENRDRNNLNVSLWKKRNIAKMKILRKKSNDNYRGTIKGKLHSNISRLVNHCLHGRKGYKKWENICGYTTEQLKEHLEKLFTDGMSWDNYGLWHVDHIIPVSAFNFKSSEDIDFKKCWALNNLQPLWAKDNLSKNDKLEEPFQPSLAIGV